MPHVGNTQTREWHGHKAAEKGSKHEDTIAATHDDPPEVMEKVNKRADEETSTRRERPKYRTIAF